MRMPVGIRETWEEAYGLALECVALTKQRYVVRRQWEARWYFMPVDLGPNTAFDITAPPVSTFAGN